MRTQSLQTEALLKHASWMRYLAISLVGDAERAEDLAQETWVKALEHPPAVDAPLRGWLATVMQNQFRQERRSRMRSSESEAAVYAREEVTGECGPELLARVKMQRELVEIVLMLEEPYRKVVLLRYFEELTPKRIAEKEGLPISTVKTQLARGIELLRKCLDRQHGGDGKGWVMALLPILEQPAGIAPAFTFPLVPLGAFLMNLKVVIVVLVLTVLGTGYMISLPDSVIVQAEQPKEIAGATSDSRDNPEVLASAAASPSLQRSTRQAVDVQAPQPPVPEVDAPADTAEALVHGRVVNVSGQPVEGLAIVARSSTSARGQNLDDEPILATSTADGTFSAPRKGVEQLFVQDAHFTTVLAGVPVTGDAGRETIVVVAPRIEVAGQVIDEYGNLVAGARVELEVPEGLRGALGLVLDFSQGLEFVAETDEEGRFEISNAPGLVGGSLRATAEGFLSLKQDAPETSESNYLLVIRRPELSGALLTGIVVDELGTPVPNAAVSMGVDTTRTDAEGGFTFDLANPQSFNNRFARFIGDFSANELIAIKPGYLPGRLAARGTQSDGTPIWPEFVMLRLGGEPLAIHGRIVDETGTALANMQVWVADPTFFGGITPGGDGFPDLHHVENMVMSREAGWSFIESGVDGSFEISGLLDRDYTVEAMDPRSLARSRERNVPAGTSGLELVISRGDCWELVRGRVVDSRGNPLAQARVQVTCDAFRTSVMGRVLSTQHASGSVTTADDEGGFELQVVPKEDAYFRVDHPDVIPIELGRSEQALREIVGEDFDAFTLVVPRRCHFQVKLDSASEADEFEMQDAEGNVLSISEFHGSGRRERLRSPIVGGQTNVLAVADTAAFLVLYLNGSEVRRAHIDLLPGEQTTLQP